MTKVTSIPGIGKTFAKDLARVGIESVEEIAGQDPQVLFHRLEEANAKVGHRTSKNYLYVLRMAVYYADGGRDPERLRWHVWKDKR